MSAPRVVYDTMVFLQAAVNPGRIHATIQAIENKRMSLCTSSELLFEVRDVLTRPALAVKFPALTPQRVAQFLDRINTLAIHFAAVPNRFHWQQHPQDDHLFNLAIESQSSYLVTWETRILKLGAGTDLAATTLRQLAPKLAIITPQQLART